MLWRVGALEVNRAPETRAGCHVGMRVSLLCPHTLPIPIPDRFDRTLGGLEMELRLREHLARLFNEQRKGQKAKDVRENPRAMAKLLREANRLKTVLSANADHMAQVTTWVWWRASLPSPEGWRALPSCSLGFCPVHPDSMTWARTL